MEVVRFGAYNIQNSYNVGLKLVLRRMAQVNIDLGLLQETNIAGGVYARYSTVFRVVVSDALSRHHWGVALFYKYLLRFAVEDHQHHSLKFISLQMVTGGQRWHMVVCYFVPHGASTLESAIAATVHIPRGADILVVGDYNTDLESTDGNKRNKAIAEAMETEGI